MIRRKPFRKSHQIEIAREVTFSSLMCVLSKLIVAVTAARALAIQQPPRLTPCLAINSPSIPAPTLPKSISRHPAIVLLNRVLLEPSECEAAAEDELVAFQNLPQFRSVPEMAHAHVFLRPLTDVSSVAVRELRAARRLRSPWAEAERARSGEAGWAEWAR